jgi:hypothetical protein
MEGVYDSKNREIWGVIIISSKEKKVQPNKMGVLQINIRKRKLLFRPPICSQDPLDSLGPKNSKILPLLHLR